MTTTTKPAHTIKLTPAQARLVAAEPLARFDCELHGRTLTIANDMGRDLLADRLHMSHEDGRTRNAAYALYAKLIDGPSC